MHRLEVNAYALVLPGESGEPVVYLLIPCIAHRRDTIMFPFLASLFCRSHSGPAVDLGAKTETIYSYANHTG
jgi:hypothetical protein